MTSRATAVLLLLMAASAARATPPSHPLPTLEEQVAHGCRIADVVAVVRLTHLQHRRVPDGEARTATLQALRMLKGEASALPARIHEHAPDRLPTDSEPPQFHEGWSYLVFLNAPQLPGYRLLLPQPTLAGHFDALVAQAQAQCVPVGGVL